MVGGVLGGVGGVVVRDGCWCWVVWWWCGGWWCGWCEGVVLGGAVLEVVRWLVMWVLEGEGAEVLGVWVGWCGVGGVLE